jgi:hypothetical protein
MHTVKRTKIFFLKPDTQGSKAWMHEAAILSSVQKQNVKNLNMIFRQAMPPDSYILKINL